MNKIVANLGTDDSVNTCDCCGKTDLKATVAFETEGGDVVHYGVVCAARAMGKDAKVVRSETTAANKAKKKAAQEAANKAFWEAYYAKDALKRANRKWHGLSLAAI